MVFSVGRQQWCLLHLQAAAKAVREALAHHTRGSSGAGLWLTNDQLQRLSSSKQFCSNNPGKLEATESWTVIDRSGLFLGPLGSRWDPRGP